MSDRCHFNSSVTECVKTRLLLSLGGASWGVGSEINHTVVTVKFRFLQPRKPRLGNACYRVGLVGSAKVLEPCFDTLCGAVGSWKDDLGRWPLETLNFAASKAKWDIK